MLIWEHFKNFGTKLFSHFGVGEMIKENIYYLWVILRKVPIWQ